MTARKPAVLKKSCAGRFVSRTSSVMRTRRWLESLPSGYRKVQDVQPGLVELVDHEADDALAALGDHADAIALAQATDEVFFKPGELEAVTLDVEHLSHVAADHPPNVNTDLLLRIGAHRGLLPCRPGVHRALRGRSGELVARAATRSRCSMAGQRHPAIGADQFTAAS